MLISLGLGLIVGIILALTGAGGGILAVPLLIFGVNLSVAQAGPIGLLAVGLAAALGASLGLKTGTVRYKAALLMAFSGMAFSPLGSWLARKMDNRWLGVLFGLVMLFVAYRTFQKARSATETQSSQPDNYPAPPCMRDPDNGRFVWTTRCARALALSGTVAGLLSGLLGVGGGFVLVPALQRSTDLAMQSVVATSLAVIALVSVSGVLSSALAGHLNWAIAVPFCGAALAGMMGGRLVAFRLAGPQLQKGFAAISAVVAIGMIVTSFR
jgi:uncharacterized protein